MKNWKDVARRLNRSTPRFRSGGSVIPGSGAGKKVNVKLEPGAVVRMRPGETPREAEQRAMEVARGEHEDDDEVQT